ncbi:oxidoreductase [candidate division KSB1 bacterium]|nr:oxidoreductase [candidate division KSB1 bacterium]
MEKIKLAENGPTFSRCVAGCMRLAEWGLKPSELQNWIQACLEMGLTTFDHADIYGDYTCEQLFGDALQSDPALREKMQLVTKCGIKLISGNRPDHSIKHYDTSKAHILSSVDNSLKMLKTDYIDLLLIHRPDPLMNADETAQALTQLQESGKVRHFGVSNFEPWQFELLASRLEFPLVAYQVEISVLHLEAFEDGTFDFCQKLRVSPMAWSPFAGGSLFSSENERAVRVRTTLNSIGEELGGVDIAQVALAWLLNHPGKILPVVGSGKIERLRSYAEAACLQLSREQWFAILRASTGRDVA